ncbi:hypothetical protein CHLRE_06g280900v5 [Chlamydomonas reinhardtii]|uniref:Golgi SNAP receptor complex member 1 n=1 Tax=Chlamydomonas reinhardtii TaxID=3055 RepID=A0A2K3DPP8_CHLRE|nr:uncharacterized protein CHLRE_06g280900v5 [Chlamydomonas reinhardtii]PNW82487.1 hypothetical protein CHLRE_06g280900v5 [Chlamydomonas reinhardtii]
MSYLLEVPSTGRVATAYMAYRPAPARPPGQTRVWEDLRKEARRLEGELDVKLAAFTKLCSSFEASYKLNTADNSLGADQQLAQTKAAEVEDLLQRLSDINDEMAAIVGGSTDSRSHTLARHRDILQEFTQEFRKVNSTLGAALDRVKLLAGASDSPHLSVNVQNSSGALLRERGAIQNSANMVDDILSQAANVSGNLLGQRRVFEGALDKLVQVGSRFPVVNGLLNAIRRKKSKDTLVLAGVIAACVLFTILYVMAK